MKTDSKPPKGLTDEELTAKYGNVKLNLAKKVKEVLKMGKKPV